MTSQLIRVDVKEYDIDGRIKNFMRITTSQVIKVDLKQG